MQNASRARARVNGSRRIAPRIAAKERTPIADATARCEGWSSCWCRHRFYHAQLGRFLTRDPVEYKGGLNLYQYVAENPIAGTDPLGQLPCGSLRIDGVFTIVSITQTSFFGTCFGQLPTVSEAQAMVNQKLSWLPITIGYSCGGQCCNKTRVFQTWTGRTTFHLKKLTCAFDVTVSVRLTASGEIGECK